MTTRIGVDTGGTFTDLVVIGPHGLAVSKRLSTPGDPAEAVLEGVDASGVDMAAVDLFAHGTTVTTNAAIQHRGAITGLLTTLGFRDVLQIRRTTRGELYDFQWEPPDELVPRERRKEVRERITATGAVMVPLDIEGALVATDGLLAAGMESLAVCFINSYVNAMHERLVRDEIVARHPNLPVYLSSEVLPEWREFDRTSTTVVSAYVGPVLARYLGRLESGLRARGYPNDLLVMAANGGLSTTAAAVHRPGYSIGSGPAAGVVAQLALAQGSQAEPASAGYPNIIGMDIGGTSTDISIIAEGIPTTRGELELEFGTTVTYPVIDIGSIGAGGGTIAWLDRGGMLNLGPQSAGSDPGPACMGRGGQEPTVTDANVLLGRQDPTQLAGGAVPLIPEAAASAIAGLGERLGLAAVPMAHGILELTVAQIVTAIRQRTVERGLDPRDFALMAYGGAGPLLATAVAQDLGIAAVLVPRHPGLTSALGLLLTDIRHDSVVTFLRSSAATPAAQVREAFAGLENDSVAALHREGVMGDRIVVTYVADLRYVGQTHELSIRVPRPYDDDAHARLGASFAHQHRREFGHAPIAETPIEIVNLRVSVVGRIDRPTLPAAPELPSPSPRTTRPVYFDDWVNTPIYDRHLLGVGAMVEGPAVIEQLDATTLLPSGWRALVDALGTMGLLPAHTSDEGRLRTAIGQGT